MTDITPIINAVIALMATIITAFVIPWLKRKTTKQDRDDMLMWVEIAVAAAQQLYHQLDGATRKQYVMGFLADMGYKVDEKEVDAAIEAAVLRLHQQLEAANADH